MRASFQCDLARRHRDPVCVASTNQQLLDLYTDAEVKVLSGQMVRFGDRELRYADLQFIQNERRRLQALVDAEAVAAAGIAGGGRFSQADFSGGQCAANDPDGCWGRY